MKKKKLISWFLIVFLVWRLSLSLVALVGEKFVPLREGYLGRDRESFLNKTWLWSWANFDGVHYLAIAEHGYSHYQQAFFPFFPYLIRTLTSFTRNYLTSGLMISHLSLIVALFIFYKIVRLDFDDKISKRSLIYLLLFPTSFYFVSVYSESLFLALFLGSFYAARRRNWLIAGILGAFASATRLVGGFLFPALLVEWWQAQEKTTRRKRLSDLLPLFLIILGLIFYMWYLEKTVGDPLYFFHVQPFFGAQRTGGKIILLYQVFWRYLKMLVTVEKLTPTYFVVVLEVLSGITFLILTIFTYFRRWFSYFIYMALAYLIPTLTGTFSSMPRYALVLFPGFILLAIWAEKYRWVRILYPVMAIPLLIISLLFFTRGYWLA